MPKLLLTFIDNIYFLKWCPFFDSSPLPHSQISIISFDYSWFLAKNLSNFVSLPWKLHNQYRHNGSHSMHCPLTESIIAIGCWDCRFPFFPSALFNWAQYTGRDVCNLFLLLRDADGHFSLSLGLVTRIIWFLHNLSKYLVSAIFVETLNVKSNEKLSELTFLNTYKLIINRINT